MLRTDRPTTLPVDVASELRDALARRQKALPPRWLAAGDALALRERGDEPGHALEAIERDLAIAITRQRLTSNPPRGVVCIQASASRATRAVVDALCAGGSISSIIATELEHSLATEMLHRVRPTDVAGAAVACDATVDLPLPPTLPRPRVYVCLGNTLGRSTAVAAVRMLRVMRTTMMPGDSILLGLDVGGVTSAIDTSSDAIARADRHLAALELVKTTTGATLDVSRFDFRPSYDPDNRRVETHLVARRGFAVEIPGVGDVRFRKGESIRTSVSCVFDRSRVSAMLTGVGLALREWTTDDAGTYVVALAAPAT